VGPSKCGRKKLDKKKRGIFRMMMNRGAAAGNWDYHVHLILKNHLASLWKLEKTSGCLNVGYCRPRYCICDRGIPFGVEGYDEVDRSCAKEDMEGFKCGVRSKIYKKWHEKYM
jgi:hypothetical protein